MLKISRDSIQKSERWDKFDNLPVDFCIGLIGPSLGLCGGRGLTGGAGL
jgi:hypothetical protein